MLDYNSYGHHGLTTIPSGSGDPTRLQVHGAYLLYIYQIRDHFVKEKHYLVP